MTADYFGKMDRTAAVRSVSFLQNCPYVLFRQARIRYDSAINDKGVGPMKKAERAYASLRERVRTEWLLYLLAFVFILIADSIGQIKIPVWKGTFIIFGFSSWPFPAWA